MKLDEQYLAVYFETDPTLKDFYLKTHLDPRKRMEVNLGKLVAELREDVYYDKSIENPWEERVSIAHSLVSSPRNMKRYYISQSVQSGARRVKYDKIDLKWFRDIPSVHGMYILNRDEFYRFEIVENQRINILYYYRTFAGTIREQVFYEAYSIVTKDGMLGITDDMNKEKAQLFVKLLLFMEKTQVTLEIVKARSGKVVFDKTKGDEGKLRNLSGMDVQLVTSNWNKAVVVEGDIDVIGHFKLIWTGPGRKILELRWWKPHVRDGYVRGVGKNKADEKEE